MSNEKDIDIHIAEILQMNRIDFFRVKNSNFRGGMRNFNTTAYEETFSCDKFFPDFIFPYGGRVYMIENGIKIGNKIANADRKYKQAKRGQHWEREGNCYYQLITSCEEATAFFHELLKR